MENIKHTFYLVTTDSAEFLVLARCGFDACHALKNMLPEYTGDVEARIAPSPLDTL